MIFFDTITAVFTQIARWIITNLTGLIDLFYADEELTFFGILAVVGLGIGVVFLLLRVIQNFLHFRG